MQLLRSLKQLSIVAAMLLVVTGSCYSQTVYSVRVYAGGRSWGPDWTLGSGSARFGLWVYGVHEDASSNRLDPFAAASRGAAMQDYTVIQLGPYSREVKAPIGVVGGVGLVGLALLTILLCAGRTISRQTASPTPAP